MPISRVKNQNLGYISLHFPRLAFKSLEKKPWGFRVIYLMGFQSWSTLLDCLPDSRYQTRPEFSSENISTLVIPILLIANPNPHCDLQDPPRSRFCRLWISLLPPCFSHTWIFLFHPIPQACSRRGPPPHWALCLEFFLEMIVGLVPSLCVGLNLHITYTESFWALQGRQDHGSQLCSL